MDQATALDLEAYFARIGCDGARGPSLDTLRRLQAAHLATIPFENVDVLLGRPIRLDLDTLQAKLVRSRRGGYCFEHNTLFAAALRALGFTLTTLEARVRPPGATRTLPRTHMTLHVDLAGRPWLADVGFGGDGPLGPVPLDGEPVEQNGDGYRVTADARVRVLQLRRDGAWRDLYAFTLDEALPVDFEVANHFTSTWPGSPFTRTLTAQLSTAAERRVLRHRTLSVRRAGAEQSREVADAELLPLLAAQFGIELPPGTEIPSAPPAPR